MPCGINASRLALNDFPAQTRNNWGKARHGKRKNSYSRRSQQNFFCRAKAQYRPWNCFHFINKRGQNFIV